MEAKAPGGVWESDDVSVSESESEESESSTDSEGSEAAQSEVGERRVGSTYHVGTVWNLSTTLVQYEPYVVSPPYPTNPVPALHEADRMVREADHELATNELVPDREP